MSGKHRAFAEPKGTAAGGTEGARKAKSLRAVLFDTLLAVEQEGKYANLH